jgi:RNA polymerase sigma factor for flagellar operon FliA
MKKIRTQLKLLTFDATDLNKSSSHNLPRQHVKPPLDEKLFQDFQASINYWASYYKRKAQRAIDYDDLVICGQIGLIEAWENYNDKKNASFKTYAEYRIRGEIIDELRRCDWMKRSERSKQKKFRQQSTELRAQFGREPTLNEVRDSLHYDEDVLTRLAQYETSDLITSYNEQTSLSHPQSLSQTSKELSDFEIHQELEVLIKELPSIQSQMVIDYYFNELSTQQMALKYQLTQGRISQLLSQSIQSLKRKLLNQNGRSAA